MVEARGAGWSRWLRRPLETLRAVVPRWLPVGVRMRLVAVLRRLRGEHERPALTADELRALAAEGRPAARPTVVLLAAVEWAYRRQRPQHLAAAIAARGWPVLYLEPRFEIAAEAARVSAEPLAEGVRGVVLSWPRALDPYRSRLGEEEGQRLAAALLEAVRDLGRHELVVVAQLPFWRPLAAALAERAGARLVYDRIDDHRAFPGVEPGPAAEEPALLAAADLVTATSAALEHGARELARRVIRLGNGCEFERWSRAQPGGSLDRLPRPVAGYFGAVAGWFDAELVADAARARPGWSFVIVGSTAGADLRALAGLANVHLLGERPYDELPELAAGFDVGMVPFRRTPLTEATDPVKVYEMLALGLPVVATALPELVRLAPQVVTTDGSEEFVDGLDRAAAEAAHPERVAGRRELARASSWGVRAETLEGELAGLWPLVSILVVTWGGEEMTRLCLERLEAVTQWPRYEVIAVDNASPDGTGAWLAAEAERRPWLRVQLNRANLGFPAATNQAARLARGEVLCFLNPDTVPTAGWLSVLARTVLEDPGVGMAGPVTNAIGNEARIQVGYRQDLSDLDGWAAEWVRRHRGEAVELPMLALFCATVRRQVWERVGGLDERFGTGMFEDDDYARRLRAEGLRLVCRPDAFVHHWQQASFNRLDEAERNALFERNRRAFNAKWRTPSSGR